MDTLIRVVDEWIAVHAPAHKGHHVQVGGGGVLCATCGLLDLAEPTRDPDALRDKAAVAVA